MLLLTAISPKNQVEVTRSSRRMAPRIVALERQKEKEKNREKKRERACQTVRETERFFIKKALMAGFKALLYYCNRIVFSRTQPFICNKFNLSGILT